MIPILFEKNTTTFTTLGIGALTDCISCTVRRVLNGMDELEMSYPETGIRASELLNSRIIRVVPEWKKSAQSYRIYNVTKPMNGIFVVYARHISEQKTYIPVMPFTASSVSDTLESISDNCAESCPFTFWTDKETVANFTLSTPASLGNVLGGMAGSILDVYGGEYEFDDYTVKLWNHRGSDRGVTLRYGKNITDIQQEESIDATITGICPFWSDLNGDVVVLPEKVVRSANATNFPFNRTIAKDFSDRFDEKPTVAQLRSIAEAYVAQPTFGVPDVSIKVSFEMLSQYKEYEQFISLESVNLGDTVHVIFEKLNINVDARVVETRYDVLNDRYKSVSIGRVKSNMSSVVAGIEDETNASIQQTKSSFELAIENATSQLTGADGGYLVDTFDLNGNRTGDMLMDTNDPATATNIWLRNIAGWGHSSSGINGPYTTAITQDGKIVADFIQAGTLQGIKIIGENGSIGGWKISQRLLDKITAYTEGVASTVYRAFISAPENPTTGHLAFGLEEEAYDGSSFSHSDYFFYVTYGGKLYAKNAEVSGTFKVVDSNDNWGEFGSRGLVFGESGQGNYAGYLQFTSAGKLQLGCTNGLSFFGAPNFDIAPTIAGHTSQVGTVVTGTLTADKAVTTSASSCTSVASIQITAGTWLIFGYVMFGGTSSGARHVVTISNTSGAYNSYIRNDAYSNTTSETVIEVSGIAVIGSTTTMHLNANSSVQVNAMATATRIQAIRIL